MTRLSGLSLTIWWQKAHCRTSFKGPFYPGNQRFTLHSSVPTPHAMGVLCSMVVKQESWNRLGMPPETLSFSMVTLSKEHQSIAKAKKNNRALQVFLKGWPESSHCFQQTEFPKHPSWTALPSPKFYTQDSYDIPPSLPALLWSHSRLPLPAATVILCPDPNLLPTCELPTTSSFRKWNGVHTLTLSFYPSFF